MHVYVAVELVAFFSVHVSAGKWGHPSFCSETFPCTAVPSISKCSSHNQLAPFKGI